MCSVTANQDLSCCSLCLLSLCPLLGSTGERGALLDLAVGAGVNAERENLLSVGWCWLPLLPGRASGSRLACCPSCHPGPCRQSCPQASQSPALVRPVHTLYSGLPKNRSYRLRLHKQRWCSCENFLTINIYESLPWKVGELSPQELSSDCQTSVFQK